MGQMLRFSKDSVLCDAQEVARVVHERLELQKGNTQTHTVNQAIFQVRPGASRDFLRQVKIALLNIENGTPELNNARPRQMELEFASTKRK